MAAAEAGARFDVGHLRSPGEGIQLELGCTLLSEVGRGLRGWRRGRRWCGDPAASRVARREWRG